MKLTSIEGDMALGRHAAIGGDASIKGSARIGHNLRVDGWLDARNIKGCDKGLHASLEALTEAYPHPRPGWWALVGTTIPATLCVVEDGCWTSTGQQAGISGEQGEAMQAIAALEARVEALEEAVAALGEPQASGFDGIINSIGTTLKESTALSSSEPECSVVYVNALSRFVLRVETLSTQELAVTSYYGTWADSDSYVGEDGKPLAGTIYMCRTNGQAYRWTGAALVAV